MTREDEIQQTNDLYYPWINELDDNIIRLQKRQQRWRKNHTKFGRIVSAVISLRIILATRQSKQMIADFERALSRIP